MFSHDSTIVVGSLLKEPALARAGYKGSQMEKQERDDMKAVAAREARSEI